MKTVYLLLVIVALVVVGCRSSEKSGNPNMPFMMTNSMPATNSLGTMNGAPVP